MIIANPVYDIVFKRLMENGNIAKGLLSRILGEEIVSLEFRPQEFTDKKELSITLFRIDFSAIVKTKDGIRRNVLIEIQKAKLPTDLIRFRNYLGSHYKKSDESDDGLGDPLPIITVYFLNFCLDKALPKIIHVSREYRDATNGEVFTIRHEFIESLTHDSYLVQIPLLDSDMENDLERSLMVFNQNYITSKSKRKLLLEGLNDTDDVLVKEMVRELEKTAADSSLDKYYELEEEMLYGQRKDQKALAEKDKEIAQKDNVIAEKDDVIAKKDDVIAEKDDAIAEKDDVIAEKDDAIAEALARENALRELLLKAGINPDT